MCPVQTVTHVSGRSNAAGPNRDRDAAAVHRERSFIRRARRAGARSNQMGASTKKIGAVQPSAVGDYASILSAAMNASCGMSTLPNWRIFFFPAFCFSSSLRLRVASPP